MEGSVEKHVIDPIESIFLNTLHFVQIAERNYAFTEYIKMVHEHITNIERILNEIQ